jgi:hypothetical protein
MNKNTLTILAIAAAAGVAYYIWKNKKPAVAPAAAAVPTAGGGSGANASTAGAYNGILSGIVSLFGKTNSTSSAGHLPTGTGGATVVPTPTPTSTDSWTPPDNYYSDPSTPASDPSAGGDYSGGDPNIDYSLS